MDNLMLAGMLHVCLSICWMGARVPDSMVETNCAQSDSGTEKQRNTIEIPFSSQRNLSPIRRMEEKSVTRIW